MFDKNGNLIKSYEGHKKSSSPVGANGDEGEDEGISEDELEMWSVTEEDGAALGYAYAGPFKGRAAYDWSCEISIYLDPAARGRGLGRALYEALERALQAMGVQNVYACIAYPEAEDEYLTRASADFHARMGLALAGRYRQCGRKFGRWYDMVWMEKLIGEHVADQPPVTPWPQVPDGIREAICDG